jgi:hypothetical protein
LRLHPNLERSGIIHHNAGSVSMRGHVRSKPLIILGFPVGCHCGERNASQALARKVATQWRLISGSPPNRKGNTVTIFDTHDYILAHGRRPGGFGVWAFQVVGEGTQHAEVLWAPSGTFTEAKAWARDKVRAMAPAGYRGAVRVKVCT